MSKTELTQPIVELIDGAIPADRHDASLCLRFSDSKSNPHYASVQPRATDRIRFFQYLQARYSAVDNTETLSGPRLKA